MTYQYERSLGTSRDISADPSPNVVGAPSTPWYLQPWFMLAAVAGGVLFMSRKKLQGLVQNPGEGFGYGWVVVVRAPDGTHEIGRAKTQDEANKIASEWMGRPVDLWGLPEERVSEFGSVVAAEEAGPPRKGRRGKQIGYGGWDYVFETDIVIEPVKVELGYDPGEYISGWYDSEMTPVEKAIYQALNDRGVEPYSSDNKVYAADARAAAAAVQDMGRTGAAAAKVLRQAAKDGRFPDPYEM
jgi:hypothetical protein